MSVNHVERAYRAWKILTKRAKQRRTITYGELAGLLGIHHRPIRYVLGVIQDYCIEMDLPPLTILVISTKGVPGTGFIAHDFADLEEGEALVYNFDWGALKNPFEFAKDGQSYESIVKKLINDPDNSGEVYRKVKSRGIQQIVFREALLKAYSQSCAFTGISLYNSLEAAHILPWSVSDESEKMDVRNGILLNSLHHKLFDKGDLTVSLDYRIVTYDPKLENGPYNNVERLVFNDLHGAPMRIPKLIRNRPLAKYLLWHHQKHEYGAEDLSLD